MTVYQLLQDFWLPISVVCAIPVIIAFSVWQQFSECSSQLQDEFQNIENTLYHRIIK